MPVWYLVIMAVQAVLVISSTIYAWRNNQRTADKRAVDDVKSANDALEHRVLLLEENAKHLPTAERMAELQSSVSVLVTKTEHLNGWLETVSRKLDRIDDWLRENK